MKYLLKLMAILLVIGSIALVVFLLTLDLNRYKSTTEMRLTQAFHRPVSIGALDVELALVPTIKVSNVTMGNPKNYDLAKPFAHIDSMNISFSVFSLFNKTFQVDSVSIDTLELNLQQDKRINKMNWNLNFDENSELGILSRKVVLDVSHLDIKKVVVNYSAKDVEKVIVFQDAVLSQMKNYSAIVLEKNHTFAIHGMIGDLLTTLRTKRNMMFNTTLEGYNGVFSVAGVIGDLENMNNMSLTLDVSSSDLNDTLSQLGYPFGALLPQQPFVLKSALRGGLDEIKFDKFEGELGNRLGKIALTGSVKNITDNVTWDITGGFSLISEEETARYGLKPFVFRSKLVANKYDIKVDYSDLTFERTDFKFKGNIDLTKQKPFIQGNLTSQYINIDDIVATQDATMPLMLLSSVNNLKNKLSFLNDANAEIDVDFAHLDMLSGRDYYSLKSDVVLKDSKLDLNHLIVKILDGSITGVVSLDMAQQVPAFDYALSGKYINTDKIKLISDHVKGSLVHFDTKMATKGDNSAQLLKSLTGTLDLELTQGNITNRWFNTLPRVIGLFPKNRSFSYSHSDDKSMLLCAGAHADIKDGTININKSLATETSVLNMLMTGQIDMNNQMMNLALLPSISSEAKNIDTQKVNFSQVIRFVGPFSNLKIKMDMDETAQQIAQQLKDKTPQTQQYGDLCRLALGHQLTGLPKVQQPVETKEEEVVLPILAEKNSLKDQFERSLFESVKK